MIGREFDRSVKTVIVGDSGVGKTCIAFRFTENIFDESPPSTLGVEFMSKIIKTSARRIEFQLWDTAGQELFRGVTHSYYRGAIGAFVTFDLCRRDSFDNARNWISDVQLAAHTDVVIIVLGNKLDSVDYRQVTSEEAQQFAKELNLMYFETSARTGENVETAILACLAEIEKLIDTGRYSDQDTEDPIVVIDDDHAAARRQCCCRPRGFAF
jgi:small GTP-binding protein